MARPRRFPDHPLWTEIDKLKAEGKPVPSTLMNKVQQDPNEPALSRRQRFKGNYEKATRKHREKKRAGKAKVVYEEKQRRKKITRSPKTYRPIKKVAKPCEHKNGAMLELVSHLTKASTGDFIGWYRCRLCKEMIRVEKKVRISA